MLKLAYLSTILFLVLTGCVTIQPEAATASPAIGETTTAGVGDSIYTYQKTGKIHTTSTITGPVSAKLTDSVRYELLYSGLSNDTLNLTYREFSNDMARPAFYQEAKYQYREGEPVLVSFRGAEIEVIKATNTEIEYRVLHGFSHEGINPDSSTD